ncbi:MAG: potassium channel family protein [Ruminococcus sp.]|nr:potassium channel family protein [Ruminococcus sp.]
MTRKEKIYNIVICVLSLVSVAFAIKDFTMGLNKAEMVCDYSIYALFVLDYFVRFILADKKKSFVKSNILDLIAIIPFNSAFRIFRTVKVIRMARLLKLAKIGSVSARGFKKTKRFLNTNGFKYVLILSAAAILISSVLMTYFEKMAFKDSLWWSFVTATIVGYGDLSPETGVGRIIACVLMLVGIGLIGSLTSSITSYFINGETKHKCDSEKVDMVLTLYEKLSDEEKQLFVTCIDTPKNNNMLDSKAQD